MAASDTFAPVDLVTSSSRSAAAVAPHNTNELAKVTKALYVGTAGDVEVICVDDSAAVVFTAVPAGSILPVRAKIVKAANTTASDIVALY